MSEKAGRGHYTPVDRMFVWLLTEPAHPILIGEIDMLRATRGVSLRYTEDWIAHGFALSEDLPLGPGEFLPKEKDTAAGALDDARPDRWGERVIQLLDKPPRLSLMEYLYFAGDDRFGALGVSLSRARYEPRSSGPLPTLADTAAIHDLIRKVLANEPIPTTHKRLLSPGVSMGGAKPKALMNLDGAQWIVKFGAGESTDTPLIEHASMTLARKAKIRTAETLPIRLVDGHAVAIKRFDRMETRRIHALSAHVALKAAGEKPGYPELAQLLRRRGVVEGDIQTAQMRELFRRMAFNILLDNTDDHEKNHVLLVNDAQQYELAPAFDVLPSGQALGYQQMRVGTAGADATLENALSMHALFALKKDEAAAELRTVIAAIENWKEHFAASGVSRRDIDTYAEQIDRPFLWEQRDS